jgi:hypothetical protein
MKRLPGCSKHSTLGYLRDRIEEDFMIKVATVRAAPIALSTISATTMVQPCSTAYARAGVVAERLRNEKNQASRKRESSVKF